MTLTVLAQAPTATTGVIAGTVAQTFHFGSFTFSFPLPGITVHLLPVGGSTDVVPAVTTRSNGSYELDGVAPGSYQVEFVDPAGKYATQWWNAAATQAAASTVTVTAGQATTGISASLTPAPASGSGTASAQVKAQVMQHTS